MSIPNGLLPKDIRCFQIIFFLIPWFTHDLMCKIRYHAPNRRGGLVWGRTRAKIGEAAPMCEQGGKPHDCQDAYCLIIAPCSSRLPSMV